MEDSHRRVQWVYESTTNRQLEERYDQWASEYDQDLDEVFAWNAPQNGANMLAKLVPADAAILDAGAGTGLVGKCLADAGFTNMAAMDLSQGMLDEARKKNVYNAFHQMTLGETLGFDTATFDAVVSVGVFTLGTRANQLLRRTGARHQAGGLHRIQPPNRHGGGRIPGVFRQARSRR